MRRWGKILPGNLCFEPFLPCPMAIVRHAGRQRPALPHGGRVAGFLGMQDRQQVLGTPRESRAGYRAGGDFYCTGGERGCAGGENQPLDAVVSSHCGVRPYRYRSGVGRVAAPLRYRCGGCHLPVELNSSRLEDGARFVTASVTKPVAVSPPGRQRERWHGSCARGRNAGVCAGGEKRCQRPVVSNRFGLFP